jgi:uncharacterized membrane protein (DUF4010 family)
MAVPLLGMGAAGMVVSRILSRLRRRETAVELRVSLLLQNPYSLMPALKFGLFFAVILLFAKVATVWWGEQGIYPASAIAGLGDASAISLSVANLVGRGALSTPVAGVAILIAAATNAVVKWILAFANGTRSLAFWMGGGFVAMLATGVALLAVVHTL